MKTGDYVLLPGSRLVGAFVRHWTASAWAHCGIVYVMDGEPMLLDAAPKKGVHISPLSSCGPCLHVAVPELAWGPALQGFVRTHLGEGYGLEEAARGGLNRRGDDSKRWNCAEWAGGIYRLAGLPISEYSLNPQRVFDDLMTLAPRVLRRIN